MQPYTYRNTRSNSKYISIQRAHSHWLCLVRFHGSYGSFGVVWTLMQPLVCLNTGGLGSLARETWCGQTNRLSSKPRRASDFHFCSWWIVELGFLFPRAFFLLVSGCFGHYWCCPGGWLSKVQYESEVILVIVVISTNISRIRMFSGTCCALKLVVMSG